MAQYIEDSPLFGTWVRQNGLKTKQAVDFSSASSVALPAGITAGSQIITSSSANAFTVGRQGTTSPAFNIDASATNSATGINIAAAASGSGVTISALGGTNESLLIQSKGTGSIQFRPGSNTAHAAVFQNQDGSATYLNIDVTNGRVGVNVFSPAVTLDVGGVEQITSTSATALTVGRQGSTNPVFQVDSSVASNVTGISIQGQASTFAPTITAISSDNNIGLTILAKGTGVITLGSGTNTINAGVSTIVQNTSANAFTVGRQGTTNPQFNVDASVASNVTGINVKGGAAGTAPIISTISSDAALALVLQALTTTNSLTINDTLAAGTSPLLAGVATDVITGAVTDGFTGALRLSPTINSAGANTVTRLNYIDLSNVVLGGAGPAAVTDAAIIRFNAAVGTHKALASNGSVATVLGSVGPTGAQTTVQGWLKWNINGTLRYTPFF